MPPREATAPPPHPNGTGGRRHHHTNLHRRYKSLPEGHQPLWRVHTSAPLGGARWATSQLPPHVSLAAAQATPSLTYHTAAVTSPGTGGFTITLAPALNNLTEDDWALYNADTAVRLTGAATANSGASYVFTATLTAGTYRLLYTKADVIVVPPASVMPAGHITVDVPPP